MSASVRIFLELSEEEVYALELAGRHHLTVDRLAIRVRESFEAGKAESGHRPFCRWGTLGDLRSRLAGIPESTPVHMPDGKLVGYRINADGSITLQSS